MPRPWLLLTLMVAFSATPLRLAEAASDLARSMVEAGDAGEIELVDGGVGDDSGEAIRGIAYHPIEGPVAGLATDFSAVAPPPRLHPVGGVDHRPSHPPGRPTGRHLLFQSFLC